MSEVNKNYLLSDGDPEFLADLKQALSDACTILKNHLHKYASGDVYQYRYNDGQYTPTPNAQPNYWTESFYPGQLWLAYEATNDEAYRDIAEKNILDFHKRVVTNDEIDWHHDIGFLYTLSSVAPYKLTGSEIAKESALMAAYSLSRRFRFKGEFIQSMGDDGNYCPQNYRFIVDTMMNLPLLFWAAEETGNMTYKDKAMRHLRTCMKYSIREDGSSYHHFLMDHETGGPIRGLTLQGAHDESFWSRGHSWIIYGLAVAYDYTGDKSLLDDFVKVTDAFVRNLPASDSIPYWDFIYNDGSGEDRDSSAAVIACCGIMEMARLIPHDICNMEKYIEAAKKMMKSLLTKRYRITPDTGEEGLIREVIGSKPHGGKPCCATYADYFFLEALIRATRNWENRYW